MFKKFSLTVFSLIVITFSINAQNYQSKSNDWDWDWDDEWWHWRGGNPLIEVNWGPGNPMHDKLTSKFSPIGLAELKLGFASFDNFEDEEIIEFEEKFSFVSWVATRLQSEKRKLDELPTELFRFGFGRRSGYGYEFGNVKILPFTQMSAVWSKLEMKDYPVSIFPAVSLQSAIEDTEILKRFDGNFRFGTTIEGGISLSAGLVSLNAGYESTVIFPRYVFWKHIGSYAIEAAGLNALDHFVDEVLDASPAAAPIVNFLLKNGYNYLFYTLKKEKMNWPFNSETPLTYETFKFGVTFTF